jgi:short subunit dehydrogenase-like uncharacterized protein
MIGVYDATGMLGRLVTARFDRLGAPTMLIGRSQTALAALTSSRTPRPTAVALMNDAAALERALDGCSVLVNCAPARTSGERLVRAALDAGIHYVDAAGGQDHIRSIFEKYDEEATQCDVAIVPALGFGNAIGDCLAHLAAQSRQPAASVIVAYAIDSKASGMKAWTAATTTGGREFVYRDGSWRSVPLEFDHAWFEFPAPIGRQRVLRYGSGEVITVPHHIKTQSVSTLITTTSLCPYPALLPVFPVIRPVIRMVRRSRIRAMFSMVSAALTGARSDRTRSAVATAPPPHDPQFIVVAEVHAASGSIGRAIASGGDVYETTAAILAQGALWLAGGSVVAGVHSAATAFEPHALLDALAGAGVTWSLASVA